MNKYLLDIDVLLRVWSRGAVVAEAIRLPDFTTASLSDEGAARRLEARLKRQLPDLPPIAAMRMRTGTDAELGRFEVELPAPHDSTAWRTAIHLRVNYVVWRSSPLMVAYIPALDLEVLIENENPLHERLSEEVLAALERLGIRKELRRVWPLTRERSLELKTLSVPMSFRSKAPENAAKQKRKAAAKSLGKIATKWTYDASADRFFHYREEELSRAANILASESPRSLLLVGSSGVGKSALARQLAHDSGNLGLADRPFYATTGARLMAGMCGFGMWQERCDELTRDAATLGAVVHLGSLVELAEAGRWRGQPGIASYLRGAIERGRLLTIAECTEEQFDRLDREEPQLRHAFEAVRIAQPEALVCGKIIRAVSQDLAKRLTRGKLSDLLTDNGLEELQRLHQRFGTYSVSPGRELRFLESICRDQADEEANDAIVPVAETAQEDQASCDVSTYSSEAASAHKQLDAHDVAAEFSRQTGLPLFLLDDSKPLDLADTTEFFRSRVIGQDHVVTQVVDTLAMVKSQLTPIDKPIASMLFIGPTGVGKTEMAKSLAEFLFRDPSRLVRIDMSEMNTPLAVERLVGGPGMGPGLLVRKIREQPFCVLLLDEFEKADPLVFDLLLQVLGEGRLTDADGQRADFSNCVVIMTSNLGVDSFRPQPFGFNTDKAESSATIAAENESDCRLKMSADVNLGELKASELQSEAEDNPSQLAASSISSYSEHFVRKTQEFLRPELFNRIDRIVAFSPLSAEQTRQIARRHLDLIKKREGLRLRDVQLTVSDEVIEHLAQAGFHPQYGARALHRSFEQELLRPLATSMSRFSGVAMSLKADASLVDGKVSVQVRGEFVDPETATDRPAQAFVKRVTKLRRNGQLLDRCSVVLNLRNRLEQYRQMLSALNSRLKKKPNSGQLRERRSKALHVIQAIEKRLQIVSDLTSKTHAAEERTLLSAFGKNEWLPEREVTAVEEVEHQLRDVLLDFVVGGRGVGNQATTVMFFERASDAPPLLKGWMKLAEKHHWKANCYFLYPYDSKRDPEPDATTPTPSDHTPGDTQTPAMHLFAARVPNDKVRPREKVVDAYYAPSLHDLLESNRPGVIGWAVHWSGDRAHALLSNEAGLHTFRVGGKACRMLVSVSANPLIEYEAPEDIHRAGSDALSGAEPRRFYHFESRKIDDVFLGNCVQWPKGNLPEKIAELMNQGLENRLWSLLKDDVQIDNNDLDIDIPY